MYCLPLIKSLGTFAINDQVIIMFIVLVTILRNILSPVAPSLSSICSKFYVMHSILIHKLFSKIYQRIIYYLPELLLPSGTYCYTITISNSKGEVRHLDFLLNQSMPARALCYFICTQEKECFQ